jgi:Leucine-rich repeat (LRR) protein
MKIFVKLSFNIIILICSISNVFAQRTPSPEKIKQYESEVKNMISFLDDILNTIGDNETPQQEKNIIITKSYTKLFADEKVQIEDDLDNERIINLNKNVQGYLQDIEFFFTKIKFEHSITDIASGLNEKGEFYFKVSAIRNLKSLTRKGQDYTNNSKRYIEINVDPKTEILKIASIYTNPKSKEKAMLDWWNSLSFDWKKMFANDLYINANINLNELIEQDNGYELTTQEQYMIGNDTLKLDNPYFIQSLKKLLTLQKISFKNQKIDHIAPLSEFTELTHIDLSGAGIADIAALRNLTKLQYLDVSNTLIDDIQALKYNLQLQYLDISKTLVRDYSVIANFKELKTLICNNNSFFKIRQIIGAEQLKELHLNKNSFFDLSGIDSLPALEMIKLDENFLSDIQILSKIALLNELHLNGNPIKIISPLISLKNLEILHLDNTQINSISDLKRLSKLKTLYLNNTPLSKNEPLIKQELPSVLVVFEASKLKNWWASQSAEMKQYWKKEHALSDTPDVETLQKLSKRQELNFSNLKAFHSIDQISIFKDLITLTASNSGLIQLKGIAQFQKIEKLMIDKTLVKDLQELASLPNLIYLKLDESNVESLSILGGNNSLKLIEADQCKIAEAEFLNLQKNLPNVLLVYQSAKLKAWWSTLSSDWKNILQQNAGFEGAPDAVMLHQILKIEKLIIDPRFKINELKSIEILQELKHLEIPKNNLMYLVEIIPFKKIKYLNAELNQIIDISPLYELHQLETVILNNNPIIYLFGLEKAEKLQHLEISGTKVKDIKLLKSLQNLSFLNISNTKIKKVQVLENKVNLKTLKCFNTGLKEKTINKLKLTLPSCEIIWY